MLTRELHLGPPADDEQMLDILATKLPFIEKVQAMKGFRNILVHKYGSVDDAKVYAFLSEHLSDFSEFITIIHAFLDKIKNCKK